MAAPSMAGDLSFLPKELRHKLLPFQRDGIRFALSRKGRCLIGDEMGLGKTLQAIAVAYHYQNEWPLLIIVPTAVRYPWIEELEKWLPGLQPNDVNLIASGTDVRNIPTCKVSIVGYGLFRNDGKTLIAAITKQQFQVVIVDESHYLKNAKAARTKLVVPIIQAAKRAILLTGTPALGRPSELYTQINSVRPNMMGSWAQYAKRYCDAHWHHYGRTKRSWDTSGASNLGELHRKLTGSIMIRREKKNVLTQLPPKRRQKVPFELAESAEKKDIDRCWLEMRDLWQPVDAEQAGNTKFSIHTLAGRMYVLTGKAKIGAVCEYVKMLLENQGLKFLVFAHHKEMMTALAQTVMAYQQDHKEKFKYIRIDGDVPSLERAHLVRQFQNDDETRVAILSILAAGTGLTLTAANQVVFAELHWTPGILEQCEDRAHRIGQINSIHVHYLVARGTMDEWIWSALSRKVSVLSSALNGKLQQLKMEEGGEEYADLLKHAEVWMPSNQDDEDDDSFYFTQKPNKSQDIRKFFTPTSSATKGKKRKRQTSAHCSPKLIKTDDTTTDSSKPLIDQSPIILDSDDDIIDEPIEKGVLADAPGEEQNRRSSLEDFVDPVKRKPIKKTVPNDSVKHRTLTVGQIVKKNSSRVEQERASSNLSKLEPEDKPTTVDLASEDDLPDMKRIIRRRPRKRKSATMNDVTNTNAVLSSEALVDLPTCSRILDDRDHSSRNNKTGESPDCNKHTPGRKAVQDNCETPSHSSSTVANTEGQRSPAVGSEQRKEDVRGRVTWNCSMCTFENHKELPFCEMCNTPRKIVTTRSHAKKCVEASGFEGPASCVVGKKPGKITKVSESGVDEAIGSDDVNVCTVGARRCIADVITETGDISTAIDDERTHIDDVITEIGDESTAGDDVSMPFADNDAIISLPDKSIALNYRADNESTHNRTVNSLAIDEPGSPMSIGGNSDISECVSEDLFADCDTDDPNSVTGMLSPKSENDTEKELPKTRTHLCRTWNRKNMPESTVSEKSNKCSPGRFISEIKTINNDSETYSDKNPASDVITTVNDDVTTVNDDVTTVNDDVTTVNDDVATINDDVTTINNDTTALNNDVRTSNDGIAVKIDDIRKTDCDLNYSGKTMDTMRSPEPSEKIIIIKPTPTRLKVRRKSRHSTGGCASKNIVKSDSADQTSAILKASSNDISSCEGSVLHDNPGEDTNPTDDFTTDIESWSETDDLWLQLEADVSASEDNQGLTTGLSTQLVTAGGTENQDNPSKPQIIQPDHSISDDESVTSEGAFQDEPARVYEAFMYCPSKHTDRIYLYDQVQVPLGCFFFPIDVQHRDLDVLPKVLHQPQNLSLARRFVKEWNILSLVKRKQLRKSGYIFDSPIQAHEALKKGRPYEMCKKRFMTKEDLARSALDKAKDVGGTIRVISKPTHVRRKGPIQNKTQSHSDINVDLRSASSTVFSPPREPGGTGRDAVGRGNDLSVDMSDNSATTSAAIFTDDSSVNESFNSSCDDTDISITTNPVLRKKRTYLQVVDKDGRPLCLYCGNASDEAESTHDGAAWDGRFCSEQCKEEHGLRGRNTKILRSQLFEAEHGICQQCGFHAHDLFTQVRDIPKSQRKDLIKGSPYAKLSATKLNEIIKNPCAGQFWHADHILAVFEGGGLCSLDNLRTLCVMCHDKVTAQQRVEWTKRRKVQQQRQAGFGDITKFFKT